MKQKNSGVMKDIFLRGNCDHKQTHLQNKPLTQNCTRGCLPGMFEEIEKLMSNNGCWLLVIL